MPQRTVRTGLLWPLLLAASQACCAPAPVRVSFLDVASARKDTAEALARCGLDRDNVRRFGEAVEKHYSAPTSFASDFIELPAARAGFYQFENMEELVGALRRPPCESGRVWDLNCFDTAILLAMPGLRSRVEVDDLMGPIVVAHTATNGTASTLPVATAKEAFESAYAQWYRDLSATAFPALSENDRIALTAALYRVHLLRSSTAEADLEPAVVETLRNDWREHRVRFSRKARLVLCHLVWYSPEWMWAWTAHAGILVQNGKGYTYLEKAGGSGPFVRIDLADPWDLMPWFAATFSRSGYSHLLVTINDTEIRMQRLTRLPGPPNTPEQCGGGN